MRARVPAVLVLFRLLLKLLPEYLERNLEEFENEPDDDEEDETMSATDPLNETMRVFHLVRHEDISGVSGTGVVAQVVEFSNGRAVVNWTRPPHATTVYLSLEDLMSVHGHGGATKLVQL